MAGSDEITEAQLKYILFLADKLGWSQQYLIAHFNANHTVRISSLTLMRKAEANKLIGELKEKQ